ncbi:MAG: hypothetical protein VX346_14525 [Planctomycetota bacterium]|nr:hypothetical protein [Planctomycetota bacterium]
MTMTTAKTKRWQPMRKAKPCKPLPRPEALKPYILVTVTLALVYGGQRLLAQEDQAPPDTRSAQLHFAKPVLLSDQNRKQDGVAFGGWGPHLRSILRMNDNSLWYVMDHSKGDVKNNDQLYYLQQQEGAWKRVVKQDLIPGANQGYAHVTNGKEIFSYGVNFRLGQLHECKLHAETLARVDCTSVRNSSGDPIALGGGANYVGAAISPQGTRLVWWVVVTPTGTQQWRYVYNRGDRWEGPISTNLPKARGGLSYIYVRFVNENEVALSGQLWVGVFPDGSAQATLTHFRLGDPIQGYHTLKSPDEKGFPKSGSDLWINPETATVHAVVEGFGNDSFGNKVHYYTFNLREPWRELAPVQSFQGYFRARFTQLEQGDLFLVLGGATGNSRIDVLHMPKDRIADPVDWDIANKVAPAMPGKTHYAPTAIWIENRAYQTTAVKDLSFAITGEYPQRDHEIWFYSANFR